jgi:hypothetical protein
MDCVVALVDGDGLGAGGIHGNLFAFFRVHDTYAASF